MSKNRACPACKAIGRDKDNDHLFLMKGGDRWACSKNGLYHEPYFEDTTQSVQQLMASAVPIGTPASSFPAQQGFTQMGFNPRMPTLAEIDSLPSLAIRSIPADIVKFYDVKCECDPVTGLVSKHYYPITSNRKLVSYKVRVLPKTFFNLHTNQQLPEHLDMFGEGTLNTKPDYCLITEGQIDAMAAFYMLAGLKGVKKVRCLSLPNGANTAAVRSNLNRLQRISNLIFCPDMDDPGRKLIPEMWKLFPNILIMDYEEKDASDMLEKGKVETFYLAFKNASRYKPSSIVSARKLHSEALIDPAMGLSYPFNSLTRLTYGLRTRSIIAIGAGPGTGKTTFIQKLIEHLVYHHNQKVGAFCLEERPVESLRRLAGHIMKVPIHLPGQTYDKALLTTVLESLEDRILYYDHLGYRDWSDVEEAIRFMAAEGVRWMVIDPLSALHTHLDATAANQFLSQAMFHMSRMIHELDITFFHINHLNNPMSGSKDHNEGADVKASQFTGSRSQWRFSTDVWGLVRDSSNPDPMIANTTYVKILKNRLSGQLGSFPIVYNKNTGTLEEPPIPTNF